MWGGDLVGHALMRKDLFGEGGYGVGALTFGNEQYLAFALICVDSQVVVAASTRGLIARHGAHRRQIGLGQSNIYIA